MGALCIQEKMCLHGVTISQKNISIFQKQDKNPLVQKGCAEKKYNYRKMLDITSIHVTNLFFKQNL